MVAVRKRAPASDKLSGWFAVEKLALESFSVYTQRARQSHKDVSPRESGLLLLRIESKTDDE